MNREKLQKELNGFLESHGLTNALLFADSGDGKCVSLCYPEDMDARLIYGIVCYNESVLRFEMLNNYQESKRIYLADVLKQKEKSE